MLSAIGAPSGQHGVRNARWLLGFIIRVAVLLAIQGVVLLALSAILSGETLSFTAAVLVAVVLAVINSLLWPIVTRLALVSMLTAPLLDVDGDARHLRVVRRRLRGKRARNRSDVPGVILFEIDG